MMFKEWLNTFIDESDLDRSHVFEIDHDGKIHLMDFRGVVDSILSLPAEYQLKIKDKLVGINFHNGDILHYLNHVAEGFIKYKSS